VSKISWVLTAGTILAAASVALAGPVWADDLNGSYTQTIIDGAGRFRVGSTSQVTFTPCGPGCVTETGENGSNPHDYHLQGDDYVFVPPSGNPITISRTTLRKSGTSASGVPIVQQLTKNG
jgi:hypothetical protein